MGRRPVGRLTPARGPNNRPPIEKVECPPPAKPSDGPQRRPGQCSTTASACGAASVTTDLTSPEYSSTNRFACSGSVVDPIT